MSIITSFPRHLLRHAALIVSSLVLMTPILWMLWLSLLPADAIFGQAPQIPSLSAATDNYARAFHAAPLLRFLANGAFVCVGVLLLQLAIAVPAGFALAKYRFRGQGLFLILILAAMATPEKVLALPRFLAGSELGLLDSYGALIFPFAISALGLFMFRQAFRAIPDDFLDAARLDGLSELGLLITVAVPMIVPNIITFAILSVTARWNDLFWPLMAVNSLDYMPPTVGLLSFRDDATGYDYGALMAAATMVVAPLLIAFILAQRWFVASVAPGGLK